jgi:hypothetical protein
MMIRDPNQSALSSSLKLHIYRRYRREKEKQETDYVQGKLSVEDALNCMYNVGETKQNNGKVNLWRPTSTVNPSIRLNAKVPILNGRRERNKEETG